MIEYPLQCQQEVRVSFLRVRFNQTTTDRDGIVVVGNYMCIVHMCASCVERGASMGPDVGLVKYRVVI